MTGVALESRPPLHLGHRRRVEAHTHMEEEVAAVYRAQPDALDAPGVEGVEEVAGGLDGVVGQADGAGEHIGGPPGKRRQGTGGAGESVGGLIEGAIATEYDHHIGARRRRPLGEAGGMAAPTGLGEGDGVIGGEGLLDDDPAPGGDRGRRRVDQQEHAHHNPEPTRPACGR